MSTECIGIYILFWKNEHLIIIDLLYVISKL